MKKFLILLLPLMIGCAWNTKSVTTVKPKIPIPAKVEKPKIDSKVITQNNIPYIAYTIPDGLKLYEFHIRKDAREELLETIIKTQNE
jgi:hypothetical protein